MELTIEYELRSYSNTSGFGTSVISSLVKSKIKGNLYFEIKDRVIEERFDGFKRATKNVKMKVFGFDETKASRELLMEILRDRMDNHKAKFTSPIVYEELKTLEVKKNGRIEHASNAHDDQVFSMLMALYVWYEGRDLMENFGLEKTTVYTDSAEELETGIDEVYAEIISEIENGENEEFQQQMAYLNSNKAIQYTDWQQSEFDKDYQVFKELMRDPRVRESYAKKHNGDPDDFNEGLSWVVLPSSIYTNADTPQESEIQRVFKSITDLR